MKPLITIYAMLALAGVASAQDAHLRSSDAPTSRQAATKPTSQPTTQAAEPEDLIEFARRTFSQASYNGHMALMTKDKFNEDGTPKRLIATVEIVKISKGATWPKGAKAEVKLLVMEGTIGQMHKFRCKFPISESRTLEGLKAGDVVRVSGAVGVIQIPGSRTKYEASLDDGKLVAKLPKAVK